MKSKYLSFGVLAFVIIGLFVVSGCIEKETTNNQELEENQANEFDTFEATDGYATGVHRTICYDEFWLRHPEIEKPTSGSFEEIVDCEILTAYTDIEKYSSSEYDGKEIALNMKVYVTCICEY